LTDRALERMSGELGQLYAATGRPSIAPERLLRALLLMVLYSVRSERQLMEQLDYNLLFRWFVGLEMDDEVWDVTVFTKNRERLIAGAVSQQLLAAVLAEARLYKKARADKSVPSYLGHVLMENRHGLVVAAQASPSATAAEREVALVMLDQVVEPKPRRPPGQAITLGADTQYQDEKFIAALRECAVAPHVSEYSKGVANRGKNALNEQERADARRVISQQKRKLIERVFG
jgi:hypothetical protein